MLDDFKSHRRAKATDKPASFPKLDTRPDAAKAIDHVDETVELPEQPIKVDKKVFASKKGRKWWHIVSYKHTHLSKPKWALLVLALLVALIAAGFGALKLYQHVRQLPPNKATVIHKKVAAKPTTEPSRLSGLEVDPALNKRPVTGVMIENSPDARPQAGLKDAGIVFEAIAEGGITRFLALFEDTQPNYIGPVRSVRPYYVDWALSFDASIAHVGGSPDGLAQIRALGARDLDEFANGDGYTRVTNRFAPHNVYTSSANLDTLNQRKGYTSSNFTSWPRKKDKAIKPATASTIDFAVSGFLYSPHYEYDVGSNSYKRSEGGQAHRDDKSGSQLLPKVVIALVLNYSIASDGKHSVYGTLGSGHMYVFQDGGVTEGTWQKTDHNSQFVFTDSAGAPLKLNAGQTWVTMVSSNGAVSYKP